jgi:tetratricopeptide (TPR) repeat protein
MASIFLSYSHEDRKRAERIAKSLESAGHQVWWDQHMRAGSRFSKDILAALKKSDLVVVLWSEASVESIWVQDEAAHGRDSGRLVPVLIDKVDPPLGFRQYHAISYGRSDTSAVVDAVQKLLSGADPALLPAVKQSKRNWRLWAPLVALALIIIGAGGWWLYRQQPGTQAALLIEPATEENAPTAAVAVDELVDAMNRFKVGPISALEILPPGSKSPATYRAQVRFAEGEQQVTLDVALSSHNGDGLWSTSLKGPPNSRAELNREAAAGLGAALACDLDLRKRKYDVTQEVKTLYLQGCSRMGDLASWSRDDQAISAFKQVTQKAPDFAPGWAHLALAEFQAINSAPTEQQASNMRWTAGGHRQMARRLDPSLPEPYYVAAFNGGRASTAEALGLVDEGLRRNPDSALLFDARTQILMHLGRLNEALESARRAATLEPLSPKHIQGYILALAYTGQMEAARRELEKARQDWPNSKVFAEIRSFFDMRWGDPANALKLQRIGDVPATDEGRELFLQARINPTPANIDAVLRFYRRVFEIEPEATSLYIQALGTFGRFEEVYRVLLSRPEATAEYRWADNEILFRPHMRPMLADPRFMDVAHRTGILSVWRKSGDWPDFCNDPKLPYDCRREAAKYPDKAP